MGKFKLKPNKGVKKRFRFSGKGKIKHDKANKGHLKSAKNAKRRRKTRLTGTVHKTQDKMIRTLLPYQ